MIPEDAAFKVPGADDPAILADIVKTVGRDLPLVREALAAIARKSDGAFANMDRDRREALINDYCANGGTPCVSLGRVILALQGHVFQANALVNHRSVLQLSIRDGGRIGGAELRHSG